MSSIVATIQLCSTEDVAANLKRAEQLIRRAAMSGAKLVCTPENTALLGPQFHKVEQAETLDGPTARFFSNLSKELGIYLLIGGMAERRFDQQGNPDLHRCFNTSILFNDQGQRVGVYRKIHLFDVDIKGGLTINESDTICPGNEIVVVDTPVGKLGLSICYDLRFPELYRALVDRGAELIAVPSAFTLTTGKDHWHALLRARAIETQTWVIAPGQWGRHDAGGKRQSYGHSLIVDPWGHVRSDQGHGEGIGLTEVDVTKVYQAREAIPVHTHRKL